LLKIDYTKPVDGKLTGILCTDAPEELKTFIETFPQLKYVKTERLTKESFAAYKKTIQESLPPADGSKEVKLPN
jgi:hypothetical protein